MRKFLPSIHGFKFANSFDTQPLFKLFGKIPVGNAANGLCGGMVLTALDYFLSEKNIPSDENSPNFGNELYHYLVKRQIDSLNLPFGAVKNYLWTAYSEILFETLKELLFSNKSYPVPLTLINVHSWNPLSTFKNHQVLAYENDLLKSATIKIYDPNYPGDDDVHLKVTIGEEMDFWHSHSGYFRGFYVSKYHEKNPS